MHLPLGVSDFKTLIEYKNPITKEGYLYVDKSLFIKAIIGDSIPVIILTRPRRFGKTLNISMLNYFFAAEVDGNSTKEIFNNLEISKDPQCMEHQGKYPVVSISFKDLKQPNLELCLEKIGSIIAEIYRKHRFIFDLTKISKDDIKYIDKILTEQASRIQLEGSIKRLLELLRKYYKVKPILLIDEYDTPLQEAYLKRYYNDLILFFRNFLSAPLKDENNLNRAILTGILRVSKESLFSGLSNVKVYSVLQEQYANYFGFTEQEVNMLVSKSKLTTNLITTKKWYNGYNFGGTTIYNPWSIIECLNEGGKLKSYWVNTSGNELIKNLIIKSSSNIQAKITNLIAGDVIQEYIDEHAVFSDLNESLSAVWSLLLMSGYLKYISSQDRGRHYLCELALPNKEVESFYISMIEEWLTGDRGFNWYIEFLSDLKEGKVKQFEEKLQILIEDTLSFHDVNKKSQESFYHGLMLAFVTGLKRTHTVSSNKESGLGRYDIALIPKDIKKLGILMEFKAIASTYATHLENIALEALMQIKESKYIIELKTKGINNILIMGIAFSGKVIKIVAEKYDFLLT